MSQPNSRALPLADATTIVRAHQKDSYFETSLQSQVSEVLHIFKGSRFVNTHPEEIGVAAKALYLALTTLIGARTLGEEYVDLIYVNRRGTRLPKVLLRVGFILSYAVVPYLITRFIRRMRRQEEGEGAASGRGGADDDDDAQKHSIWALYPKVLDTVMNLHIAVFYFQGHFYSLSKRIFGFRYAFGHNKDPKKMASSGNYSFLGGLILLQFFVKSMLKLKSYNDKQNDRRSAAAKGTHPDGDAHEAAASDRFASITDVERVGESLSKGKNKKRYQTDLADPAQLPYVPENSRDCMLCLSPMVNPAAANCGHFFCWDCIVDWVREHPECPLCRQGCIESNLLPLR